MCIAPRCFTPQKSHPKGPLQVESTGWTVSRLRSGVAAGTCPLPRVCRGTDLESQPEYGDQSKSTRT